MAITRLNPPPINVDANDFTFKKWFQDIYSYSRGGILVPTSDLSQIYGANRNVLINGDFKVWQRGTTLPVTSATPSYFADRWCALVGGGTTYSITRQTGPSQLPYCLRFTHTAVAAGSHQTYLAQSMETIDSLPLAGQTVTISFWLRKGAGFSGNIEFVLASGTGTDENLLSGYTGGARPIDAVNIVPATTWTFYQFSGTIASTATEVATWFIYNNTNAGVPANDYYEVSGVQLEFGSTATAFDFRPFSMELVRCQRYYQKSFPYAITPATNTGIATGVLGWIASVAGAAVNYSHTFPYIQPMRKAPTLTYYNPMAANANTRNLNTSTDSAGTTTTGFSSAETFHAAATGVAGWAIGHLLFVHWAANAEI